LLRELVRASELVGFELTEFEAPSNPGRRARAVQTVIRMIEPVLAGPDRGKRVCEWFESSVVIILPDCSLVREWLFIPFNALFTVFGPGGGDDLLYFGAAF
jgi:hypothetical protein